MKKVIIWFIKVYQITPLHAHSLCRYTPSCSNYTIDAINNFGVFKGLFLGFKRILRCNPLGGYGYDPIRKRENQNEKII